jgi:hypothetical protein
VTGRRRLSTLVLAVGAWGCRGQGDGEAGPGTTTDWDTGEETDDGKPDLVCMPGETRCADASTLEICAPTGLSWDPSTCSEFSSCVECEEDATDCTAACKGPCDAEEELPSSAGCSFFANRMIHLHEDEPDALIVGNPSTDRTATITLFEIPEGKRTEEVREGPLELAPGASQAFSLDANFIDLTGYSRFRTGGNYRLQSDIPVVAYQHSPFKTIGANDASLLLPERALRNDYVVASYAPDYHPSYFEVIATEDETVLEWTPPVPTAGNGFPIPFVAAGKTGSITMNRFDIARIAASSSAEPDASKRDVSGTVVHSDKPVWVVGASRCSEVPKGKDGCDHLQELLLPIDYWGNAYVAAPSPPRADEPHVWRIYAGARSGVTITADPPVIEPIELAERGEWVEITVPHGLGFVLEGDGPFMPVQYLVSSSLAGKIGDPAMYQMVPSEQFLGRYVFVTGVDYDLHYAQVIRHAGAADVFIDGDQVTGYYQVGDFEIADWLVSEGAHLAESDEDFGVVQIGYGVGSNSYTGRVSYAYPGGLKVEEIALP